MVLSDRFSVLGVGVDALTNNDAVDTVARLVRTRTKGSLVFCTVSSILSARRSPDVRKAMGAATIVTPDGMPLVWLGRKAQPDPIERVYGPDFMLDVLARDDLGLRHFFYGGAPGVAEEMVAALSRRFPRIQIAGWHSPDEDIDPAERSPDVGLINRSEADVVWVGLGHPKQELWMERQREALDAPVIAGVGAAFDFLSGRKKEAPTWMKRSGLQWLHRLVCEPRRLWRRYLIGNTQFVLLLAQERFFGRRDFRAV